MAEGKSAIVGEVKGFRLALIVMREGQPDEVIPLGDMHGETYVPKKGANVGKMQRKLALSSTLTAEVKTPKGQRWITPFYNLGLNVSDAKPADNGSGMIGLSDL